MTDNYDRLCTRVWDKQKKRMLYQGASFSYKNTIFEFRGVNDRGLIVSEQEPNRPYIVNMFYILPFRELKDRFMPMMCTAAKTDDAKKLLYESDIIKHNSSLAIIKWDLYEGLYAEPLIYDDACIFHSTAFETCSYVGNKWEQPKLLEVKA